MTIGNFLFGRQGGIETYPAVQRDQRQLLEDITKILTRVIPNYTQTTEDDFETYAAPFRRDFLQRTLPEVENRYADVLGSGSNYEQSSGLWRGIGENIANFEQDLASRRIGMRNEDFQRLMQLLGPSLQPRDFVYNRPTQTGFIENGLLALIKALGGGGRSSSSSDSGER